jgi:hypothetical protein
MVTGVRRTVVCLLWCLPKFKKMLVHPLRGILALATRIIINPRIVEREYLMNRAHMTLLRIHEVGKLEELKVN